MWWARTLLNSVPSLSLRLFEFTWRKVGEELLASLKFEAEDAIAIAAAMVAIIFALAMVFGAVPINALTAGIVACTGAGLAVARVVKARKAGASRAGSKKKA